MRVTPEQRRVRYVTPIRDVIEDIETSVGCEVGLHGEVPGRYRYGWRFCVL